MDELYFKGEKYISSRRAAKITGYTKDYVGQLCRGAKVTARLVGRNWYVHEESLLDHKNNGRKKHVSIGKKLSEYAYEPLTYIPADEKDKELHPGREKVTYQMSEGSNIPTLSGEKKVIPATQSTQEPQPAMRKAVQQIQKAPVQGTSNSEERSNVSFKRETYKKSPVQRLVLKEKADIVSQKEALSKESFIKKDRKRIAPRFVFAGITLLFFIFLALSVFIVEGSMSYSSVTGSIIDSGVRFSF